MQEKLLKNTLQKLTTVTFWTKNLQRWQTKFKWLLTKRHCALEIL